jgi:hypothetical protein
MRAISKPALIAAFAGLLSLSACKGSYYVAEQPVEPVYERPISPYAGAVWVDGDWAYSGGTYIYRRGYWSRPRVGRTYVRGSWAHTNRGYRWNRGRWR